MDALLLARMQFAANISFHILFPTITHRAGLDAAVLPLALAEDDTTPAGWRPTASGPRCSR